MALVLLLELSTTICSSETWFLCNVFALLFFRKVADGDDDAEDEDDGEKHILPVTRLELSDPLRRLKSPSATFGLLGDPCGSDDGLSN